MAATFLELLEDHSKSKRAGFTYHTGKDAGSMILARTPTV
jgi:hypothetical protein